MTTLDSEALRNRLWDELRKIRTGMLGLSGSREAHSQPMTAHVDSIGDPVWYYTNSDSEIAAATKQSARGVFHYAGPDHQLYACIHGNLKVERDQGVIDRFWDDDVARWFPKGRTDPSVTLLKFDPDEAQIWLPSESTERATVGFGVGVPDEADDIREKTKL